MGLYYNFAGLNSYIDFFIIGKKKLKYYFLYAINLYTYDSYRFSLNDDMENDIEELKRKGLDFFRDDDDLYYKRNNCSILSLLLIPLKLVAYLIILIIPIVFLIAFLPIALIYNIRIGSDTNERRKREKR